MSWNVLLHCSVSFPVKCMQQQEKADCNRLLDLPSYPAPLAILNIVNAKVAGHCGKRGMWESRFESQLKILLLWALESVI